jgi:hypothetical protein
VSLVEFAEVANDATNIGWLLLAAVLVLVMAAIGVVCLRRRTLRMRRRQTTPVIAHRDSVDEFIENALRYDRDQRRLRGEDLHDVFGGDDD